MGPAPRKRLGTDAAEQALFLHTRDCLCTLPARSCEWKINNSMSCRRRNNATLHQTGPRFPVSLESVLHKALPFGLYINVYAYLWHQGLANPLVVNSILLGPSSQQRHLSCLLLLLCAACTVPALLSGGCLEGPPHTNQPNLSSIKLCKALNAAQSLDWCYRLNWH